MRNEAFKLGPYYWSDKKRSECRIMCRWFNLCFEVFKHRHDVGGIKVLGYTLSFIEARRLIRAYRILAVGCGCLTDHYKNARIAQKLGVPMAKPKKHKSEWLISWDAYKQYGY